MGGSWLQCTLCHLLSALRFSNGTKSKFALTEWTQLTPSWWLPETLLQTSLMLPNAFSASETYGQLAGSSRPWDTLCLFLSFPRPETNGNYTQLRAWPPPRTSRTSKDSFQLWIALCILKGSPRPVEGSSWTWPTLEPFQNGPITRKSGDHLQTTTEHHVMSPISDTPKGESCSMNSAPAQWLILCSYGQYSQSVSLITDSTHSWANSNQNTTKTGGHT